MDPQIIAAIITGSSTIIAAIIGCLVAEHISTKYSVKQKIKGDYNVTSGINEYQRKESEKDGNH